MSFFDTSNSGASFSALSALASTVSGVGQFMQGRQQQGAYNYNADVTLEQMKESEASSQAKYSTLIGRQRSLYAKAGVDIASGSPLLVAVDTAAEGGAEYERIHEAGTRQAEIERYYGKMAAFTGTMGGIGTFLSGLSKAGEQYRLSQKWGGLTFAPSGIGVGVGGSF